MERELNDERGMMNDEQMNRAMRLTPPGAAAIAVVRLAGPGVQAFLSAHFSRPAKIGRCVHGVLTNGQHVIDDPIVVLSNEGLVADINLHGGERVMREFLDLARRQGFQIVDAGLDLLDSTDELQRELLAALPQARTEQAIRMLLAQPRAWSALKSRSDVSRDEIEAIVRDRCLWWMLHPPRVAIVGAANVGKSTLANQLFGRDRSITADVPGTTRDWVGDWANIDGLAVHLLDTPGQWQSSDPIEQAAVARSLREIETADLAILVLDASQSLEPAQSALRSRYAGAVLVVNKCDLPPAWDASSTDAVHTVAVSGRGIQQLRDRIRAGFGCEKLLPDAPHWWTERQKEILHQALRGHLKLREI